MSRKHKLFSSSNNDKNNSISSEYSPHSNHKESTKSQTMNVCKICGQSFESAMYLMIHRQEQHPQQRSKQRNKRLKMPRAQCQICGQHCPSRQSLYIHMKNKHNNKNNFNNTYNKRKQPIYSYQCGCGGIFQTTNLFNTHIHTDHKGVYPKGCIKTISYNQSEPSDNGQTQQNRTQQQGQSNQLNDLNNENSKYGSQSQEQEILDNKPQIEKKEEEKQQTKKVLISQQKKPENQPTLKPIPDKKQVSYVKKRFKCGCGKSYSCASSLNLHIKMAHNWIIPVGTIGGPRGLWRVENQIQFLQNNKQIRNDKANVICSDCGQAASNPYYNCKTCPQHNLCEQCFWAYNQLPRGGGHEWVSMDG